MTELARKLTLDETVYWWRVIHRYRVDRMDPTKRTSVDQLTVFRDGVPKTALRILFVEGPKGGRADDAQHGVVMFYAARKALNLHRPKTVTILIRRAIELGWSGEKRMTVNDGFAFVEKLQPEVQREVFKARSRPPE